jgi:alkaline phosphatase D
MKSACLSMSRRRWMMSATASAAVLAGVLPGRRAHARRPSGRPSWPCGIQIGDVRGDRAVIWAATDRPTRLQVRWSTRESLADATQVAGVMLLDDRGHTGKLELSGLPADQRIFVELTALDLGDYRTVSEPLRGSFRTPPSTARDVRFLWSGDTAGQGWGINPDFGGMRIYDTMRAVQPDFFIHSGDTVYADGPIRPEVALVDGTTWRNLVTPEKSKVAESLEEFRGQYRYNLLDEPLRRFNAEVPMLAQWDDHEVTDNWYWEMRLDDDSRYREGSVALLAARAMRAFHEFMPVRRHPLDPDRIYDRFPYGPHLEVFRIDLRSYRGPNSDEQPRVLTPEFRILGSAQLDWLKQALQSSTATWKVIASDMPLGLVVYHDFANRRGAEAIALRDGPPAGRELEVAELLTFIRDQDIGNVVWLTADVHYTAAHHYDPSRAQYPHFAPFWEFVSGPLHAGTFGPNRLDDTFGPEAVFVKAPPPGQVNLPPSAGLQFFGQVDIDGDSGVMTVRLKDLEGETLFAQVLQPA